MAKNLCYQMTSSIENALSLGEDKHSAKSQHTNPHKIYSYASRKEMIDLSHDFSNYLKANFPEIRMVRDINVKHINDYLSSKDKLTQTSIQQYSARLNKLELCCNKKFGLSLDWRTGREIPVQHKEQIRNVVFSDKQIQGIEKYLETKKDCYSKSAYYLAKAFSLRAASVVKLQVRDVDLVNMKLHIHEDKGKRSRDLDIRPAEIEMLKNMINGKNPTDRLIPLRSDSICAYLNRVCKILGYTNITDAKTSYHCLRKYSITQYYKEQEKIVGPKRAEQLASIRLGHGEDRKDIIDRYIFR